MPNWGFTNADTQQNITQYFNTVPAEYLDLVLRIDAACMQDVQDSQEEWDKERGAIEQEVARDLSNPTYKFITRLNEDLFAGTPYAHDALGTQKSFDATTGAALKDFYKQWYAPNNAILVITGSVDPDATIKRVKELYGPIPKRTLPSRPEVKLQPSKAESFTMESDLPYQLVFLAYRSPGSDSQDYAGLRVLSEALASEPGGSVHAGDQGRGVGHVLRPRGNISACQRRICGGGYSIRRGCVRRDCEVERCGSRIPRQGIARGSGGGRQTQARCIG
jgi:zinc protease